MFINFGYEKDFPYPQISLDLKEEVGMSSTTQGLEGPNLCSAVLIAGKYLDHLDEVMLFMKNVTIQTLSVPFAVFLFTQSSEDPSMIFSHENRSISFEIYLFGLWS